MRAGVALGFSLLTASLLSIFTCGRSVATCIAELCRHCSEVSMQCCVDFLPEEFLWRSGKILGR